MSEIDTAVLTLAWNVVHAHILRGSGVSYTVSRTLGPFGLVSGRQS